MAAKGRQGSHPGNRLRTGRSGPAIGGAVHAAIGRGFLIGRGVLIGRVHGVVVGYNIASFGKYPGNAFPLLVRTTLGVVKCAADEVSLA